MKRRLHQELIELLVAQDPRIGTSGFMKNLRKRHPYLAELIEHGDHLRAARPDAHFFDDERKIVFAIEVEVTHPLDEDALLRYWELLWAIDEDHWDFRLITIDRRGVASLIDTMVLAFHPDGHLPPHLRAAKGGVFAVREGNWRAWLDRHLADFDAGKHWTTDELTADHPQLLAKFLNGGDPDAIWVVPSGRFVLPRPNARLLKMVSGEP